MWPLIVNFVRVNAVYIVWPAAFVLGTAGYFIEKSVRGGRESPWKQKSIAEMREERILKENVSRDCTNVDSIRDKTNFIPKDVLERNKVQKSKY